MWCFTVCDKIFWRFVGCQSVEFRVHQGFGMVLGCHTNYSVAAPSPERVCKCNYEMPFT